MLKNRIFSINALLLNNLFGSNSSQHNSPLNNQRKEEEQFLNAFLDQEDFGTAILQHFTNLISQMSSSHKGNILKQISIAELSQITDENIQGYYLVPFYSNSEKAQNELPKKRENPTNLECAGPSAKIQKGNKDYSQNDVTDNDSQHEVDEVEVPLPKTPEPPAGLSPQHTSLGRAYQEIITNDKCESWMRS